MARLPFHGSVLRGLLTALPWFVLALGLSITWAAWRHERDVARLALHSQFDFALRETVSRIEQRVLGYEQMLRGVQSLFATTSFRNRAAFRDYVESLQLDANFAGVQALGLVEWVPAQRLPQHLAAMRSGTGPDYAIKPAGARESYAPIIQREPYVGRNRAPVGGDTWNDAARRHAMEKARDSGMTAITGKLRLMVSKDMVDAPPGFVMYLPVYAHGKEQAGMAQRQSSLIGWVYASFHMNDFMASLYGRQAPGLALAIHDDTKISDASLLYRTSDGTTESTPEGTPDRAAAAHQPAFRANEYLVVAGHNWTLSLSTQPEFEERYGRGLAGQTAWAGSILSLALTLLVWLTITARARAVRLAEGMTEQLRHVAQHDVLTGLPNRALFADRLSREIARAQRHDQRFALAFLDLDNFKSINDSFGHGVGDQVIEEVARRLLQNIRAADTAGRIGGDEFVILLSGLGTPVSILAVAEKIRDAVLQPMALNGRALSISCSIGVAVYPHDGSDAITLTASADQAMYAAKNAGRNCIRLSQAKTTDQTPSLFD